MSVSKREATRVALEARAAAQAEVRLALPAGALAAQVQQAEAQAVRAVSHRGHRLWFWSGRHSRK